MLKIIQVFSFIAIVSMFSLSAVWGADPLSTLNSNLKSGVSTFQLIALTIAGVAIICVALAGMFTQMNKALLLQMLSGIILIAGAALFVDWIAGLVK